MIDRIYHNSEMSQMSTMPDNFIDCIVTDPPYGISFMGKAWDKALPSVDVWKECLRVLKPGAFAFIMSIPRQDCLSRMIVNLEDAGFMVNFSPILWAYATGFPKAANLSKLADKRAGVAREVVGKKEGTYADIKRDTETGQDGLHGGVAKDRQRVEVNITAPATPEAKALEGAYAGFQAKPCYEVVLVVMKPCTEKTYLDQALSNGHGCTHLDAGRIPYESDKDKGAVEAKCNFTENSKSIGFGTDETVYGEGSIPLEQARECVKSAGRYAPNLLVSDDALNDGKITKSGVTIQPVFESKNVKGFQPNPKAIPGYNQHADSGSFSRYFSLDAWAEKNLPDSVNRTFPFLIVPKASKKEKNAGLDELEDKQMYKCDNSGESLEIFGTTDGGRKPRKNAHPTVKPIKLMSYLIAIGSRPGDVVYDPYMGSGTTGISCALSGRHYIGTEIDGEMVDIGERRIKWHVEQAKKEEEAQPELNLENFEWNPKEEKE